MEDLRVIITAQGKRGRLGFGGLVIILKRVKLKRVKLFDFRSYTKREFVFDEGTTVVVGENGAGKTNLLEGIYFLATGKSFRAGSDLEVIRHGQSLGRVIGELEDGGEGVELEVVVGDGSAGMGRKKFMVNGVGRRLIDFSARLKAVMFGPWDLELVDGSPGRRRDYLDRVLCLVDREYRRALGSYEKGIRQRNRLLIRIREGQAGRGQTLFWDKLVVKNGNYISSKREEYLKFLNEQGVRFWEGSGQYGIEYDKSVISEERLEKYAREEVLAGVTLVGPHRDDFTLSVCGVDEGAGMGWIRDVSKFGSRGEQRMGVLWLKLGEVYYTRQVSGVEPILLLDDVFSELDSQHRELVKKMLGGRQSVVTCADKHVVEGIGGFLVKID